MGPSSEQSAGGAPPGAPHEPGQTLAEVRCSLRLRAQEAGVAVLHYDRHCNRLAEVLGLESRWIAPAGSLDAS